MRFFVYDLQAIWIIKVREENIDKLFIKKIILILLSALIYYPESHTGYKSHCSVVSCKIINMRREKSWCPLDGMESRSSFSENHGKNNLQNIEVTVRQSIIIILKELKNVTPKMCQ